MNRGPMLCLLVAASSAAATAVADDGARAAVEQRLRLATQLLSDGAAVQRIVASGQERALALLEQGRQHHVRAQQALAAGELADARWESEEALRLVGVARRLVPDNLARQDAARARLDQRLAAAERLLAAWRARLPAGTAPGASDEADDRGREEVAELLTQARRAAAAGQLDDAARSLAGAELQLSAGLTRLPQQRTVDYTARAAGPAEQFGLELARHEGLVELLPLAVAQYGPRGEALALIERYADVSRALRRQAIGRQQAGDLPQALADLHNAVLYVQRALAAAGVALPQPVE